MSATQEAPPQEAVQPKPKRAVPKQKKQPPYNVILLDDDDHTHLYVIEMLGKLFGHNLEKAYLMAVEVDTTGRVIVDTATKERAELKRDQIMGYGADPHSTHSAGSMSAVIEPVIE